MTLRYLLTVCAIVLLGVPCEAYSSRFNGHQVQASGDVWAQLGWPSLPDFRRPVYTRPYYQQWPLSYAGEEPNHHAQWPSAVSSRTDHSVKLHQSSHNEHRPHQTSHTIYRPHQYQPTHPVHRAAAQTTPTTRGDTRSAALPVHQHSMGRRPSQQWILPRRFLTSTDTGRGQGVVQTCQDGKVWQNGRCECPYLSNWNEDINKCECVYGTYRHFSGNCRSY